MRAGAAATGTPPAAAGPPEGAAPAPEAAAAPGGPAAKRRRRVQMVHMAAPLVLGLEHQDEAQKPPPLPPQQGDDRSWASETVSSLSASSSLATSSLTSTSLAAAVEKEEEAAAPTTQTALKRGRFGGTHRSPRSRLLKTFNLVNRKVGSLHEHVSPKYTPREREIFGIDEEYGGITGTLRPGCFERLARYLRGEEIKGSHILAGMGSRDGPLQLAAPYRLDASSVFCDIGSGTGRPVFYLACLEIRASVGFDVDPMQVLNSLHAQRLLQRNASTAPLLRTPTCFFHEDVLTLKSLGPTTHAFAFLGYPDIVKATTLLVAQSGARVFVPVVLHYDELRLTGILDADPVDDEEFPIVLLPAMQMPGGSAYSGMVIPMTATRRRRVIERLGPQTDAGAEVDAAAQLLGSPASPVPPAARPARGPHEFAAEIERALAQKDGLTQLSAQKWAALSEIAEAPQRRRRRAAREHAVNRYGDYVSHESSRSGEDGASASS